MRRGRGDFRNAGGARDFRLTCTWRHCRVRPSLSQIGGKVKDRRLHREDPGRTTPIRNFTTLYRRTNLTNGVNPKKPAALEKAKRPAGSGPLVEGVELAYSVIDKYIAEGRQTAEGLSAGPYTTRIADDNLQGLLARLLRFQAEILPLWIDTVATLVTVQPSQNGHISTQSGRPHSNGTKESTLRPVAIEVASRRPAQVSLDLSPDCETQSLVALSVNSIDANKRAITGVSFVPDDIPGRLKLLVRIADDQPSGTYTGVIIDRNRGDTRGTLSIKIAEESLAK